MKVLGKSKKNHRILLVTEYEWQIITEAMSEYEDVCSWSSEGGNKISALTDIKRVNNRLSKAVKEYEKLETFTDVKKITE